MIGIILATALLVGDSHTTPVVGDGAGPGYVEFVDDASWWGCAGATSLTLDTQSCSYLLPTLPAGETYLRDVVVPLAEGHHTVTLFFGTNDLSIARFFGLPTNTEGFAARMVEIGEVLRAETTTVQSVVLIGAPDRLSDLPHGAIPYYKSAAVQEACDANEWLLCGPDFSEYIFAEHYDGTDGLHPNAEGHRVMGEVLNAYLVPEPNAFDMMAVGAITALLLASWRIRVSGGRRDDQA